MPCLHTPPGQRGRIMEVHGLRIARVDLQRPFALCRFAEMFGDRPTEGGQQLLGDVLRNVADEIVDELARRLRADPFLFRIAITGVTEIGAIEGKVNVLGEAAERAERF